MSGLVTLSLSLTLFAPPNEAMPASTLEPVRRYEHERRSRRLFIASGVLMGLSLLGEMSGAIVSSTCQVGNPCTVGFMYQWGSNDAGTRFTVITAGAGSAYVNARLLSIPLVWTSTGLLLAGAHARARADGHAGVRAAPKRLAWALLGSGIGLYVGSRLTRLGFGFGGVCQDPGCVYAFDQLTLSLSRGLSFSGSALVMHRRTQQRVELGFVPMFPSGVSLTGRF